MKTEAARRSYFSIMEFRMQIHVDPTCRLNFAGSSCEEHSVSIYKSKDYASRVYFPFDFDLAHSL